MRKKNIAVPEKKMQEIIDRATCGVTRLKDQHRQDPQIYDLYQLDDFSYYVELSVGSKKFIC